MAKYIPLDALVAEIENLRKHYIEREDFDIGWNFALNKILSSLDTFEVKEVESELIVGWFEHIAQMADDRKTLNGEVMEDWAALDEIKCLAKNSADFIQRHYKAQKGE